MTAQEEIQHFQEVVCLIYAPIVSIFMSEEELMRRIKKHNLSPDTEGVVDITEEGDRFQMLMNPSYAFGNYLATLLEQP